jgi:hypothetical protein
MRGEYRHGLIVQMKKKHIDDILSGYDGTLCSTTSVKSGIGPVDVEYCNMAGFSHVRN